VASMALLLRLAVALDRRPAAVIAGLRVEGEGSRSAGTAGLSVALLPALGEGNTPADLSLERWSLLSCAPAVLEATGLKLRVPEPGQPRGLGVGGRAKGAPLHRIDRSEHPLRLPPQLGPHQIGPAGHDLEALAKRKALLAQQGALEKGFATLLPYLDPTGFRTGEQQVAGTVGSQSDCGPCRGRGSGSRRWSWGLGGSQLGGTDPGTEQQQGGGADGQGAQEQGRYQGEAAGFHRRRRRVGGGRHQRGRPGLEQGVGAQGRQVGLDIQPKDGGHPPGLGHHKHGFGQPLHVPALEGLKLVDAEPQAMGQRFKAQSMGLAGFGKAEAEAHQLWNRVRRSWGWLGLQKGGWGCR